MFNGSSSTRQWRGFFKIAGLLWHTGNQSPPPVAGFFICWSSSFSLSERTANPPEQAEA
jgi:hypothetical protein